MRTFDELTAWSAFGVVAGVAWFLKGFRKLRIRRRIEGLATSRIRSMAMGIVELCGMVRAEAPLKDPIFQRPCAYFRIHVKEKRGSGKNSRWVTIYRNDSEAVPFFIEDATGVARVCPARAELHFMPEVNDHSNGLTRSFKDDAVSKFLATVGGGGLQSRKVIAHILRPGQPLFVVGHAAPIASASMSLEPASRDAARLLKSSPAEMKRIDANGDGVVDGAEWDAGVARKAGELQAAERLRQLAEAPPCDPVVSVTRCPDGLFILASDESELLSKLGLGSWLGIIGGPLVTIASVAYLFLKYGAGL